MAGGIQPGTIATSVDSILSENRQIDHVVEAIKSMGPDWEIRKSITIEDILGEPGEYSFLANGNSQRWESDGGWIYRNNKLVGVCENKWQASRKNACERAFRYLGVFRGDEAWRIFVSCEGPGFVNQFGGGATGPFIDIMNHAGATVLENEHDPDEYARRLREWLNRLANS